MNKDASTNVKLKDQAASAAVTPTRKDRGVCVLVKPWANGYDILAMLLKIVRWFFLAWGWARPPGLRARCSAISVCVVSVVGVAACHAWPVCLPPLAAAVSVIRVEHVELTANR